MIFKQQNSMTEQNLRFTSLSRLIKYTSYLILSLLDFEFTIWSDENVNLRTCLLRANEMLLSFQLHGWSAQAVTVTVEQNTLAFAGCIFARLDPVAPPGALPHSLDEAQWAASGITSIVLAHDLLDRFTCLIGVIEGNGRDVVVEDVGFNDAVEEVATNETEFTIDCCSSTTSVCPG
jgi:hypothetical protein